MVEKREKGNSFTEKIWRTSCLRLRPQEWEVRRWYGCTLAYIWECFGLWGFCGRTEPGVLPNCLALEETVAFQRIFFCWPSADLNGRKDKPVNISFEAQIQLRGGVRLCRFLMSCKCTLFNIEREKRKARDSPFSPSSCSSFCNNYRVNHGSLTIKLPHVEAWCGAWQICNKQHLKRRGGWNFNEQMWSRRRDSFMQMKTERCRVKPYCLFMRFHGLSLVVFRLCKSVCESSVWATWGRHTMNRGQVLHIHGYFYG